ncbi:MAG TPA: DUF1801 domain-containing protein [Saprospiraceae bacterium]|nr:DUF1801 domain-containing protein [Saprospiraceae bacterium]
MKSNPNSVSDYINNFPPETSILLEKIRTIILNTAPDATESLAYGMPAYKTFGKPLVYFAAYKNHIGLYATPSGHSKFEKELSIYKQGKGSVQFPLDKPLPLDLITKIVEFRKSENETKFKK